MFNFFKKIKDKLEGSKPAQEETITDKSAQILEDKPDVILEKEIEPELEGHQESQSDPVEDVVVFEENDTPVEIPEVVEEEPSAPEIEPVEDVVVFEENDTSIVTPEIVEEEPPAQEIKPVEDVVVFEENDTHLEIVDIVEEEPPAQEIEPVEDVVVFEENDTLIETPEVVEEEPPAPEIEPVEDVVVFEENDTSIVTPEIVEEEPPALEIEPVEDVVVFEENDTHLEIPDIVEEEPSDLEIEPVEDVVVFEENDTQVETPEVVEEEPSALEIEPVEDVVVFEENDTQVETPDIVEEEPPALEIEPVEDVVVFEENDTQVETPENEEELSADRPKGWFGLTLAGFKNKISKTSDTLINSVVSIATGRKVIDDDAIDEIEEKLIKADIGIDTAVAITDKLRDNMNKITPDTLKDYLRGEFTEIIKAENNNINLNYTQGKLNIYLITGVNGVGKTTLIGKLAYRFTEQGKKVLIGAGDTFRAAAEQQLEIWSKRANADIVRRDGADPASVVYDSIVKAKNENYDVLLIDTAGRLHNKFNLMQELGKIKKIIDKNGSEYLAESLLVLDATTGQNGLQQARIFQEAVSLTSVALTKLDGSAKGGIIIAIASELKLPVKLVGVGEKIDDLRDFDPDIFMEALFS